MKKVIRRKPYSLLGIFSFSLLLISLFLFVQIRGINFSQDNADKKFVKIAQDIHLNKDRFASCLKTTSVDAEISKNIREISQLGIKSTPHIYINGKLVRYDLSQGLFEEIIDKEISGKSSTDCKSYSDMLQRYCLPQFAGFEPDPKKIGDGNFRTDPDSVVIDLYGDIKCLSSLNSYQKLKLIMDKYPGKIALKFNLVPFVTSTTDPEFLKVKKALKCAEEQNKYQDYLDLFLERRFTAS